MLKKFIPKSSYARNVITLMTGTGLAQAIPIAISPILTRLYGPDEFGVLGLYMAVVSIVVVLVTGRYELAILLPRQDRDAMNVMAVSVLLSGVISAVLWVLVAVFNRPIAELLGEVTPDRVIVDPLDPRVVPVVSEAVARAIRERHDGRTGAA